MRLALGAGVVSLMLLEKELGMELDRGHSQRWEERSQPPWERFVEFQKGLDAVRSVDGGRC